jgi:hypothetical protein
MQGDVHLTYTPSPTRWATVSSTSGVATVSLWTPLLDGLSADIGLRNASGCA